MKLTKLDLISLLLLFFWCSLDSEALSANRRVRQVSCLGEFQCDDGECLDMLDVRIGSGVIHFQDESEESASACDCGIIKGEEGTGISSSGNASELSDALQKSHPWTVDIYRTSDNHYKLLCTGSLIYVDIVLTAASCVYDTVTFFPYETSSMHVSAGKVFRDFNVTDTSQQTFKVSRIVILDGYEGESNGFLRNLALIMLNEPIKRTDYVKPICLWEEPHLPVDHKLAVSRWNTEMHNNRTKNLAEARVGFLECHNTSTDPDYNIFLSQDKFCLDFDQGVGLNDFDTGGGIEVYSQGRHYLVGILSLNRTGNAYGLATEVRKYIPWIRNTTYQLIQDERRRMGLYPRSNGILKEETTSAATTTIAATNTDTVAAFATATTTKYTTSSATARTTTTSTAEQNGGCPILDGYEKFTLTKCNNSGGCADAKRASHGSEYKVTCLGNRRFAKSNETDVQMICFNGEWRPSLDEYKCIALCPEIDHKSLDLQCYYSRKRVSCNQKLIPGTVVYANCKKSYQVKSMINFANHTMCQEDGSFKRELTECTPVCGKTATSKAQILISKGTKVNYPKYPWHIALYWKIITSNTSFGYEYKCGGTLIDRNKVLTAAHCIWDPTTGKLKEAKILEVVSGKIYSKWDALDGSTQKVGVAKVIPATNFKGVTTRYEQDIAVLILSEDLELSDFTMPACLDLDLSAGGVPVGQLGHVVGWGREDEESSPSEILMETWMEYLDLESCHIKFRKHSFQEYLLSDKFCVIYINGSGTQQGDSGGGLTFLHGDLHYVYGVVSIKKLGQNEFAAVTNVSTHRHWLQDIMTTNGLSRGCSIPQGGTIFHLMKCGDLRGCKNKDWAPLKSTYNVTCAKGYGFSRPNQTFVQVSCSDGKWLPGDSDWKCLALCPGMEYKSLSLRCSYLGSSVLCNEPLIPGTKVRVKCKRRYKLSPTTPITSFVHETLCGIDGRIQQELQMCESACGKLYKVQPLIVGGITSGNEGKFPEYPWHILIYRRKDNFTDKNDYEYICGGTLIDSNKVLTAAHCIWDARKGTAISAGMLVVASGKRHNMWSIQEFTQQRVGVSKVIPGLYYNGVTKRYLQDIAVLILSNDIQLSDYTMPVCLDLDLSAGGIPERERGQVIIWNLEEGEEVEPKTIMKEVWMQYRDLNACREMVKSDDFFNYLVEDKFCILYNNGTGPQKYDSGAGLTFVHDDQHYVYGVVALKKTGQNLLGAVTNVTMHRNWLLDILATY